MIGRIAGQREKMIAEVGAKVIEGKDLRIGIYS
jgi:hypothetical protein